MKRIIAGSRMVVSGMTHTASAVGSVLGSIPCVSLTYDTEEMSKVGAKDRIAEMNKKFGPKKIRLGDFDDDVEALRRDALVLGEDMKVAERRLKGVE